MIRFYFALASFLLAAPLHAGARPNVVFILSDDQRADTIAALGNKQIKTPALDRLVKNGTFFSRAYCMGGMQGAICVPSRAMILSGRTLFRVRENLDKQTTWPEVLTRLGYATFMTGKWHNGRPSALRSFQLGDSVFFGGMGNPLALPVADFARGAKVRDLGKSAKHAAVQFADEAVAFIKKQKRGQPFLAYVAFTSPHDPRVATKELHDYYDAHKPPLPANFLPVHPFDNGEMTVRDEKLLPWPRTEKDVRQALADYYACITLMDAQVGRILAALEEAGLLENTIIIFASDHGLAIGSHGLLGKQNLYDHSMRAPLIVAGPGLPKGKTSDALCYLLDICPTVLDLTGSEIPAEVEGKSLAPLLRGKATRLRESLLCAYRDVQRSVRDERWHLIRYPKINKTQLFDLETDPEERADLAADPAQARRVEHLMDLLRRLQKQTGDEAPLSSARPADPRFVPPTNVEKKKTKKARD